MRVLAARELAEQTARGLQKSTAAAQIPAQAASSLQNADCSGDADYWGRSSRVSVPVEFSKVCINSVPTD